MVRITLVLGWAALVRPALADEPDLATARQLADDEARYDEAERLYERVIEQQGDPAVAAELAALYERLGEIDAAVALYERAVGEGGFDDGTARRLEAHLDWCRRQRPSRVRFPVSVEAEADVREIEALLRARQWPAAFAAVAGLLERFDGTFRQQGPGQFFGVWAWARATLDALGDEGQSAYLAWSRPAYAGAISDGSAAALHQFVRRHPALAAARPAWLAWADTLADQGRFARALGLLDRGEQDAEPIRARRTRWQQHVPAPGATHPAALEPILGHQGGCTIRLRPAIDGEPIGLATAGGRLFIYQGHRVDAFDPATGRWLWRYAPTDPADRIDVPRERHSLSKRPKTLWAGAIDPPAITVCPTGVLIVERYYRGEIEHVYARLTCLDSGTGRVRWRSDGDPALARLRICSEPICTGGKVLIVVSTRGPYPEFSICALDADDGQLLWRRTVATGATPTRCIGKGVLHAGQSGPTLVCDGSTAYYATQMGAVVALDHDLGQPLWAVSYPRVPRCGPITTAPLTLLERSTQPICLTPTRLVVLPRDFNGLLVIDRSRGELQRTIRSLDLLELVHATDDLAVVGTVAGEIRAYALRDGSQVWSWRPPTKYTGAVSVGGEIIVSHGTSVTRLNASDGSVLGQQELGAPAELRRTHPEPAWVAIAPDAVRVLGGEARTVEPPPPSAIIARARASSPPADWTYDAFLPARRARARLIATPESATLIVADRTGLAAYAPREGYARRWWRPFDPEYGLWAASIVHDAPSGEQAVVAVSDDRETVTLLDPITGEARAVGAIEAMVPIRALHVVGPHVLIVGTSQLLWADAGEPAAGGATPGLRTFGPLDVAPRVFEAILPGRPMTLVFVQPGGGEPGRLLHIEPSTGRVADAFVIAAPLPEARGYQEPDRPERFAVKRLTYSQSQLRRDERGWFVAGDDGPVRLYGGPIRLLERLGDSAMVEVTDYWGLVDLASGHVTLVSPSQTDKNARADTPEQEQIITWLRTHPRHHRPETPAFTFAGAGLCYRSGWGRLAEYDDRPSCSALLDASDRELALGNIRPTRIEVLEPWLVVQAEAGTLVLRKNDTELPPGTPAPTPGRAVADLFDPPAAVAASTRGLVLDGDLSDWPTDGWERLTPRRHAWPVRGGPPDADNAPVMTIEAAFQWAIGTGSVWLAVDVRDDVLSADRAAPTAQSDRVDLMLAGRSRAEAPRNRRDEPPAPVVISVRLADHVPIAYVRSPGFDLMVGRPVGLGARIDPWLRRRYADSPRVVEEVAVSAARDGERTLYELRIDRSLFETGEPTGFDIRIRDDDGTGISGGLEWGGALYDSRVYPLTPLEATGSK